MKYKTYKEGAEFPDDCWFADWQPSSVRDTILHGDVLIRRRDEHATLCIIAIPTGGRRGIPEKDAEAIADFILKQLNKT